MKKSKLILLALPLLVLASCTNNVPTHDLSDYAQTHNTHVLHFTYDADDFGKRIDLSVGNNTFQISPPGSYAYNYSYNFKNWHSMDFTHEGYFVNFSRLFRGLERGLNQEYELKMEVRDHNFYGFPEEDYPLLKTKTLKFDIDKATIFTIDSLDADAEVKTWSIPKEHIKTWRHTIVGFFKEYDNNSVKLHTKLTSNGNEMWGGTFVDQSKDIFTENKTELFKMDFVSKDYLFYDITQSLLDTMGVYSLEDLKEARVGISISTSVYNGEVQSAWISIPTTGLYVIGLANTGEIPQLLWIDYNTGEGVNLYD